MEGIIAALIAGGCSIAGIIISTIVSSVISGKKTAQTIEMAMKVHQAVTETKIDELTREVRVHNGFAEKIPVLEYRIGEMHKEIKHLREYHEE